VREDDVKQVEQIAKAGNQIPDAKSRDISNLRFRPAIFRL